MSYRSSLAARMTGSYLLASCLIFGASAAALYWTLNSIIVATEQRLLSQKIELFVSDQQREPDDYQELFTQLAPVVAAPDGHLPYLVRILDSSRKVLAQSPGMDSLLPADKFPDALPGQGTSAVLIQKAKDHRSYRVQAVWSNVPALNKQRLLEVGMDISSDRRLLSEYRKGLVMVVLVALALLAALTYFLTRRGLKPLDEIGRRIATLGPAQLHQRLYASAWPQELAQFAEGFNSLLERLDESFKRLSQFSADLAHELRTPIHNLRLQADVVLARPRKTPEYKQALESALEEYIRLTKMTEGLLFLARAENGKQELNRQNVDVMAVFREIKNQFEPLAQTKKISIKAEGGAVFTADLTLLNHALSNLLSNACAHTGQGGKVILSAKTDSKGNVEVTVTDTGEGIPAADLPKVFDRFYRVDTSRKRGDGSGLGLSLVKTVMDLHHGRATIESRPSKGTAVTLIFPKFN